MKTLQKRNQSMSFNLSQNNSPGAPTEKKLLKRQIFTIFILVSASKYLL